MESFYLEKPSLERQEEIVDFLEEYRKYNSETNGLGALRKVFEGKNFREALDECLKMENEEYASSLNKCASKTFLLIRRIDKKIIGAINIRWQLKMSKFGSNIGYSIRPTERRKGYNKINLYLGLLEAQKLGLDKVVLVCESDNVGSYKTIEALGGILNNEEIDPSDGILTKIYSIDVRKSILDCRKNIWNK